MKAKFKMKEGMERKNNPRKKRKYEDTPEKKKLITY